MGTTWALNYRAGDTLAALGAEIADNVWVRSINACSNAAFVRNAR